MLAVAALSLGPAGTEAAWLQAGYDAARTGATPDAGPAFDDVAWTVGLPGSAAFFHTPLILDGAVYVLTSNQGWGQHLRTNGLFKIDLATAEPELLVALDRLPSSLASDRSRVFIARDSGVDAYALPSGERLWTREFPPLVHAHDWTLCPEPAVHAGVLYVACTDVAQTIPGRDEKEPTFPRAVTFVEALDTATGALRWRWVKGVLNEVQPSRQPMHPDLPVVEASAVYLSATAGISVIGPAVLVSIISVGGRGGILDASMWGLRADDGTYRWSLNSSFGSQRFEPYPFPPKISNPSGTAMATGTRALAYFKLDALVAVNPWTGEEAWRAPVGPADTEKVNEAKGLALFGEALFVTSDQTIYRFNTTSELRDWWVSFPPDSNETWGGSGLVVAGDTVYARAEIEQPPTTDVIYAFDASSGQQRWRHTFSDTFRERADFTSPHFAFAVGERVMAVAGLDGTVTVLGQTPASLQPVVSASSLRPAPGEEVRLDVSASRPGLHGAAGAYSAYWGDGTSTEWQPFPVLAHIYELAGDYRARVIVRNGAGQTASEEVLLRVGAPAQPSPAAPSEVHGAPAPSEPTPANPQWLLGPLGAAAVGAAVWLRRSAARGPAKTVLWAPGALLLGRYRVRKALGTGGSGAAWLCSDERIGRDIVLKRVRAPGAEGLAAVLREAQALAGVRHPNVVALHRVENVGGEALLVMEYVEGGSLAERLRGGPLSSQDFPKLVRGTLEALAAVHAACIVHRDIKPSNLLLTRSGSPKLADFGVAHLPGFETTMGGAIGAAVGTVRFMSPEQARGKRATPRSDLFSAAATFYEAYTGQPYLAPEESESAMEVQLRAAKAGPFRGPLAGPAALQRWFAKALDPAPEARFASAVEMRREFDRALSGR